MTEHTLDSHQLDAVAERHMRKVQQNMRILLMRRQPSQRRQEAAYWLGESGQPQAITALRQVYLHDPDPQVQQAAREALAKFKALQQALQDNPTRRQQALELVRRIMRSGIPPSRLPLSFRIVLVIEGLLVLTFVLLLAAGGMLGDAQPTPQPDAITLPTLAPGAGQASPASVVADLLAMQVVLTTDARHLQEQFQALSDGLAVDCVPGNRPPPYTLPSALIADQPDLVTLVDRINALRDDIDAAQALLDSHCQSGQPVDSADLNQHWSAVVAAQRALSALNTDLNRYGI